MDSFIKSVERMFEPISKELPALPDNARKTLVKVWPFLALIFGILQLFTAYGLWQLGHAINTWTNYTNQLSVAAGGAPVAPTLGLFYYLSLAILVIDGVILLVAFTPLKAHKKQGWGLLMLGTLLNLLYGVVIVFVGSYGGFGSLLGALISSAIGLYLLFQVREYYMGAKSAGDTAAK